MQSTIQRFVNDIAALARKISILDTTAFSIEQEYRRKHQEIQELTAQKDRIEKFIANILNGEGYSKLMQVVKENVKTVLSDNKIVILVAFAALIQTIKADPQMVKLIQNMTNPNDGEQYKGNNNIVQYLESNKDRLLYLTEKHYENLVDALTNNAISSAAITFSNPTLSMPQSSSTYPGPSNKIATYRIEEPEIYDDNSKGDIVD